MLCTAVGVKVFYSKSGPKEKHQKNFTFLIFQSSVQIKPPFRKTFFIPYHPTSIHTNPHLFTPLHTCKLWIRVPAWEGERLGQARGSGLEDGESNTTDSEYQPPKSACCLPSAFNTFPLIYLWTHGGLFLQETSCLTEVTQHLLFPAINTCHIQVSCDCKSVSPLIRKTFYCREPHEIMLGKQKWKVPEAFKVCATDVYWALTSCQALIWAVKMKAGMCKKEKVERFQSREQGGGVCVCQKWWSAGDIRGGRLKTEEGSGGKIVISCTGTHSLWWNMIIIGT